MIRTRDELLGLARGYWPARAVLTAVELGLFEALGARKLGLKALARRVGAEPRALGLLLDCLAGQGVLVKTRTSYAIAAALRPLVSSGPQSALGMLRHHAALWKTWSALTESVRTGSSQPSDSSFRRGPAEARAFTLAMRDGARRLAPGVAAEVNLRGRRLLLDLGGGPGVYATALARLYPKLRVVVVDLPDVAAVGAELVAEEKDVHDRVSFHGADIDRDPLPAGADAAFLSHVMHANDEPTNRNLFARAAAALPRNGLFVVRDFFLDRDRTTPASSSLFALNMLVNTPGGRCYTVEESTAWLKKAGFGSVAKRRSKVAPDTSYLLARKG